MGYIEERTRRYERRFSGKGDISLNQFTDAIIEDIGLKLNVIENLHIYGGSTFMEWYKLKALNKIELPALLIHDIVNFSFEHKNYVNLDSNGSDVIKKYGTTAFPIDYGIKIEIMASKEEEVESIKNKIAELYHDEVKIKVGDVQYPEEFCVLKLIIDESTTFGTKYIYPTEDEMSDFFDDDKDGETWGEVLIEYYQSAISFKRFPNVYYVKEYEKKDLIGNPRLQFRLCQQAEFVLLSSAEISNSSLKQLQLSFKEFIPKRTPLLGFLYTAEYKKIKSCWDNGLPMDRALFDKYFETIVKKYPNLYDKMYAGWSYEQIYNDLDGYAKYFEQRWNHICDLLGIPVKFDMRYKGGWTARSSEGLQYYINKMFYNPCSTIAGLLILWQMELEERERDIDERNQRYVERRQQELMEEAYQRRNERHQESTGFSFNNGKKDLFGTAVCQRTRRSSSKSMNRFTCMGCPARERCTQQYR